MKQATLCIVRDGNRILLGMKKRGFGSGKYNGFGGKVENAETIEAAALRELREESGMNASFAKKSAVLTFKFPHKPEWNQIVHVFVADKWSGSPVESDEMRPEWFDIQKIPYNQMWIDDAHWLPHILAGNFVHATFVLSSDTGTILEKDVKLE